MKEDVKLGILNHLRGYVNHVIALIMDAMSAIMKILILIIILESKEKEDLFAIFAKMILLNQKTENAYNALILD